jgi:hypothetical protein
MSSDVHIRKPGRPWHYYGFLRDFYRDENPEKKVPLVWYDQVTFQEVPRLDFRKSIEMLIKGGFHRIGFLAIQTSEIVDPYDIRGLAADNGAQQVVASVFPVSNARGVGPVITHVRKGREGLPEYQFALPPANIPRNQHWYAFLSK